MSVGAAIGLGAVLGLALGIVVSVITAVPLAPEARLVLVRCLAGSRAGTARRPSTSVADHSHISTARRPRRDGDRCERNWRLPRWLAWLPHVEVEGHDARPESQPGPVM